MLPQIPQHFDSTKLEPAERLNAFSRFVDTNPRLGFNQHRMRSFSAEGPEVHRVERKFGDGIGISRVETSGHIFSTPSYKVPGGPPDRISLCYVDEGIIELRSPKGHTVLRAGDFYIIEPTNKSDTVGPGVATRMLLPRDALRAKLLGPDQIIRVQGATPTARLLKCMISAVDETLTQTGDLAANNALHDIAKQMVVRLLEADKVSESRDCLVRDRVREFVLDNLTRTDLSPKEIAEYLGMSRASLYRAFSATDGVMAYVTDIRLEVARSFLSNSNLKNGRIYEIAYLCGFKSATSFSQAFKKAFGETPSKFGENKVK